MADDAPKAAEAAAAPTGPVVVDIPPSTAGEISELAEADPSTEEQRAEKQGEAGKVLEGWKEEAAAVLQGLEDATGKEYENVKKLVEKGTLPDVWRLNKEAERQDAVRAEQRVRRAVLEHAVEKLEKAFHADIDYTADWLLSFRRVADTFEWLALILSAASSVLAYLAGILTDRWWAFAAGILGTISLGLAAIGRYCNSQSKERTQQLNKLLGRFGMLPYPDVVAEFSTGNLAGASEDKATGNSHPAGKTVAKLQ